MKGALASALIIASLILGIIIPIIYTKPSNSIQCTGRGLTNLIDSGRLINKFNPYLGLTELQHDYETANTATQSTIQVIGTTTIKQWTIGIYISADNNLDEIEYLFSLSEEEPGQPETIVINPDARYANAIWDATVGKSLSDVNVLLFRDGVDNKESTYPAPKDNFFYESTTALYIATTDGFVKILDYGELNMGAQLTFELFLDAVFSYPANHYMIVIYNHGKAWKGISYDETSKDLLSLDELRGAFQNKLSEYGISKIDILDFDACIMGSMEVAYQLYPFVRYFVFSEETELLDGQAYALGKVISDIISNPQISPLTVASNIVTYFAYFYSSINNYKDNDGVLTPIFEKDRNYETEIAETLKKMTLSAIRAYLIDDLAYYVNRFAGFLINKLDSGGASFRAKVETAYSRTEKFTQNQTDLKDFVKEFVNIYGYQSDAIMILTYFDYYDIVFAEWHGSEHPDANGLSIYFPDAMYVEEFDDYEDSCEFTRTYKWDEFIWWYYEGYTDTPLLF